MKLLALETSTEACSVALHEGGQIISRFRHAPRLQTELLLPMLDEVLAEAGWRRGDISLLAYSRGPGAFTGVRIAAAAVQALAFAGDLPVVAVSSLQTLAQGAWRVHGQRRVLAVFDARMEEVYAGAYALEEGVMQAIGPDALCAPAALPRALHGAFFLAGNGAAVHTHTLRAQVDVSGEDAALFPAAEDIVPLALKAYEHGQARSAELALPVYLRDEVWKKLPGRE